MAALTSTAQAMTPPSPRAGWRSSLATLPGIALAFLPKIACPACWPAYAGVLSSLGKRQVDINMPKYKFESEFSLVDPLTDMGMGIAFSGDADFSGINGTGGLAIQDVIHKAFVSVNEAGTEAAAATAVIVGETSAPEPAAITFDKPFLFFIRDIATKQVLFVGRVADPS